MRVGFTSAKTVTMTNTSNVPLTYHAGVPNDGSQPAVCFDRLAGAEGDESEGSVFTAESRETVDTKPQEFSIQPSMGVIQPDTRVAFTVTMCPNSTSKYMKQFAVNFDEVIDETFTIPISAEYANCIYLVM